MGKMGTKGHIFQAKRVGLMPPKTWKKIELALCRIFGGRRSGPEGKQGPDCKDTYPYAIQCKHRPVPKWLNSAMRQTVRDTPDGWIPTLLLHDKGTNIEDTYVIIPLREFRKWYLK
jgi:hypothetical protein